MYSLPSTSRKREPCPPSTNSGYGAQPDQVARAVLLTPPGMERQASSNNLALRDVSSPSASWALPTDAAALIDAFIRFASENRGSFPGRSYRREHAPRRIQLASQQRRQQADRVGETDDRGVRNRSVPAVLDQSMLGEHVIGFTGGAKVGSTVADQQHAMLAVVFAHRTRAFAMTAADPAMRIGERRFEFPFARPGLHQPVGEDGQAVELVTRQDRADRVIEPVAYDPQGGACTQRRIHEGGESGVNAHHRQVFVDLLARGIEQRDLAGHALGGAD